MGKMMEEKVEVKRQRYANIDILKMFAIFCVIMIHCCGIEMDFLESGNVSNYIYYFSRTILATSVPIFFLCNGFLLFGKELDMKEHVFKTIKYFIMTYLWGIITIFCTMLIKDVRLSLGEIINMFREWQPGWINHLWFLGALVRVYLIFPILKLAAERKRASLMYLLVIVVLFVTINKGLNMVKFVEPDNRWLASFGVFNPFRDRYDWAYVYFIAGGVLWNYREVIDAFFAKHRRRCNVICGFALFVSCILLFICGVVLTRTVNEYWDVVWEGYGMIFTMCAVLAMYILSLNYRKEKDSIYAKAVRLIGANTLGIYFVHMMILHIWNRSIGTVIDVSNMGTTLLCAVFLLGISLIVTLLMKKIPVIKMLVQ